MDSVTTNLAKDLRLGIDPEVMEGIATVGPRSTPDSCRETLRINNEEQAFHHHLTLGIQEKLQKNRMVKNVKMQFWKPADKQALSLWERKNGVTLPSDLKDYYQSTNGFKLTWSLEHAGDVLPIGEMNINPLHQLVEIHIAAKQSLTTTTSSRNRDNGLPISTRPKTCSADSSQRHSSLSSSPMSASSKKQNQGGNLDQGSDSQQLPFSELEQTMVGSAGFVKLAISGLIYSPENKMFILDSGRSGWGKVCLVYASPASSESPTSPFSNSPGRKTPTANRKSDTSPYVEIWFMDPSFQWHFLAPTFTHFYRMLLFHMGLPQWQYRFTPFGLSSWAEQMFWLVAPHLLQSPKLSKFPSMYHGGGLWCTDVPSETAAPNSTVNTLSNQLFRRKKKDKDKYQN